MRRYNLDSMNTKRRPKCNAGSKKETVYHSICFVLVFFCCIKQNCRRDWRGKEKKGKEWHRHDKKRTEWMWGKRWGGKKKSYKKRREVKGDGKERREERKWKGKERTGACWTGWPDGRKGHWLSSTEQHLWRQSLITSNHFISSRTRWTESGGVKVVKSLFVVDI